MASSLSRLRTSALLVTVPSLWVFPPSRTASRREDRCSVVNVSAIAERTRGRSSGVMALLTITIDTPAVASTELAVAFRSPANVETLVTAAAGPVAGTRTSDEKAQPAAEQAPSNRRDKETRDRDS